MECEYSFYRCGSLLFTNQIGLLCIRSNSIQKIRDRLFEPPCNTPQVLSSEGLTEICQKAF